MDWLNQAPDQDVGDGEHPSVTDGQPYGKGYADWKLCKAGIPIVDCVTGLDQIKKPRVFFIALPVKIGVSALRGAVPAHSKRNKSHSQPVGSQ